MYGPQRPAMIYGGRESVIGMKEYYSSCRGLWALDDRQHRIPVLAPDTLWVLALVHPTNRLSHKPVARPASFF